MRGEAAAHKQETEALDDALLRLATTQEVVEGKPTRRETAIQRLALVALLVVEGAWVAALSYAGYRMLGFF